MIYVKLYKNNKGYFHKYTIEGHANYAEYGKDVVCAGVSALGQSVLLTLESLSKTMEYEIYNGWLSVSVTDVEEKETQTLFKLLEIGVKAIEGTTPNNIKVTKAP
ncbi:MAG TPA: ribosomal-processing cysteine protease Prp [Tissierellaceae bacterium]|nr:ribosomal-processing cysteine protease Prp [Tissierellaceae bacterium]